MLNRRPICYVGVAFSLIKPVVARREHGSLKGVGRHVNACCGCESRASWHSPPPQKKNEFRDACMSSALHLFRALGNDSLIILSLYKRVKEPWELKMGLSNLEWGCAFKKF